MRKRRTAEQEARYKHGNRVLRLFESGLSKDLKQKRFLPKKKTLSNMTPEEREKTFKQALNSMLPGVRKMYEDRIQLAKDFIDGKASSEEFEKKVGVWFTKKDVEEIQNLKLKTKLIEEERKFKAENSRLSRKQRKIDIEIAKKNVKAYIEIGEAILQGKIKTENEMLQWFSKRGISLQHVHRAKRHWRYGFDELLTERKEQLKRDISELKQMLKENKWPEQSVDFHHFKSPGNIID